MVQVSLLFANLDVFLMPENFSHHVAELYAELNGDAITRRRDTVVVSVYAGSAVVETQTKFDDVPNQYALAPERADSFGQKVYGSCLDNKKLGGGFNFLSYPVFRGVLGVRRGYETGLP